MVLSFVFEGSSVSSFLRKTSGSSVEVSHKELEVSLSDSPWH